MTEFERIYREYFDQVFRYIRGLSGDVHLAEDITSETFCRALRSIDGFRGDCDIRVWLCQIAKNCYYSHLKKERRVVLMGILLAAAVLAVLAGSFFARHWVGTARQGDAEGLTKGAESYLKVEGLHLERTQRRSGYMAVLLTDADEAWYMCVYERDSVFTDRWRAGGSSGGSDGITVGEMDDWLFGSPEGEAVMIYCGVGLPEEAKWYAFRHGGTPYISPIEEGMVLDVFVVSDSSSIGTMPVLLDEEKEPLVMCCKGMSEKL